MKANEHPWVPEIQMRYPGKCQEMTKSVGKLPYHFIASLAPWPNLEGASKAQAGHAWQGNADACSRKFVC